LTLNGITWLSGNRPNVSKPGKGTQKESRIKNKRSVFRNAPVGYSEFSDSSAVSSQSLLIMTSREGHRGDINRNTMKLSLL
jgi:hypothetical protein